MKFPSIKNVAQELRLISANVEGECDVRLQVYPDGSWWVRYGDSSYDQDHRGYWGASCVPGCGGRKNQPKRFQSIEVAKDLIEQVKDHFYMEG